MCASADASSGVSYGPKYYKTWLPRGLPNIINVDILQHQKPENDAANDPEACSRLYDQTLQIIRKRVSEIEAEQKSAYAQKTTSEKSSKYIWLDVFDVTIAFTLQCCM